MKRTPTLALVLSLAALACGGGGDGARAAVRKVRVVFNPHLSWGPLMIAQAEGFFRDEGLEVEFVSALRSEEGLVALVTGDVDVLPGPLHAGFLSAVARGAPIRITAGLNLLARDGCTYYGIVLRRGLDTARGPSLTRMRAGQDGVSRYVVSRMLAQRGIALRSIETVRLPEAVVARSMESGALDAVAVSEPALSRVARLGTLWLSGQEALPDFQWGVVAFGQRLLVRERETGERFLRAYHRGVAQYRQGKTARNVAIIAEGTGETLEGARAACWPTFRFDSSVNWESITRFQEWARSEGLMEQEVSRDQALDSAFVSATLADDASPPPRPTRAAPGHDPAGRN